MLRAFGVRVPVVAAIASLPVVFFIAVLPISVQGIGTTQAAMVFFFARYGTGDQTTREAAVLAESLVTQAIALGFQSLLGLACLRSRIGRDLRNAARTQRPWPPPRRPRRRPSPARPPRLPVPRNPFDGGAPRQLRSEAVATRYKQPNAINGVSIALVVLVAATAWLGVSAWPVIALNSNVKNELNDALPRVYRANLRDEPGATIETTRLHDELEAKIRALGVDDGKLASRSRAAPRRWPIEVRYHAVGAADGAEEDPHRLAAPARRDRRRPRRVVARRPSAESGSAERLSCRRAGARGRPAPRRARS